MSMRRKWLTKNSTQTTTRALSLHGRLVVEYHHRASPVPVFNVSCAMVSSFIMPTRILRAISLTDFWSLGTCLALPLFYIRGTSKCIVHRRLTSICQEKADMSNCSIKQLYPWTHFSSCSLRKLIFHECKTLNTTVGRQQKLLFSHKMFN